VRTAYDVHVLYEYGARGICCTRFLYGMRCCLGVPRRTCAGEPVRVRARGGCCFFYKACCSVACCLLAPALQGCLCLCPVSPSPAYAGECHTRMLCKGCVCEQGSCTSHACVLQNGQLASNCDRRPSPSTLVHHYSLFFQNSFFQPC